MAERIAEFKFLAPVARAITGDDGELVVEGVASSPSRDSFGTIISREGQASMAAWANTGEVILGGEADHFAVGFDDDLGVVTEGQVLESGDFRIRAVLDRGNPRAVHLHTKLLQGTKLGLSVFGEITKSHVTDDGVMMIDGVRLRRVMVTKQPANPDTWIDAIARSLGPGGALAREEEGVDEERTEDLTQELDAEETEDPLAEGGEAIVPAETADAVVEDVAPEPLSADEPEGAPGEDEAAGADPGDEANLPAGVRVARSFAQAAELLLRDSATDVGERRERMRALIAHTAEELEKELPAPPDEGQAPGWAQDLVAEVRELRARVEEVAAMRGIEDGDRAPRAQRKTAAPSVRPSRNVARAQTFRDIVDQLFAFGPLPE